MKRLLVIILNLGFLSCANLQSVYQNNEEVKKNRSLASIDVLNSAKTDDDLTSGPKYFYLPFKLSFKINKYCSTCDREPAPIVTEQDIADNQFFKNSEVNKEKSQI